MNKGVMRLVIIAVLLLTSCSVSDNSRTEASLTGLRITQMSTSIGASEGNPDEQLFSYDLTLFNSEPVDVVVHWIEPVLVKELADRVLTPEYRVMVEKTIEPNFSLAVSGEFTFQTSGAAKEQILSWEPFFTGITVSSEITLALPGQEGE